MKKSARLEINNEVLAAWEQAGEARIKGVHNCKRLRFCTAWVYETDDYYYLHSHNTIVAFIDKSTDTLYDVLRYVCDYTSASAQHIAKFDHDYCAGYRGCSKRLTYYPV